MTFFLVSVIVVIVSVLLLWRIWPNLIKPDETTVNLIDDVFEGVNPKDLYDFLFDKPKLTEIQRHAWWQQQFKNKKIKWTIRIDSISEPHNGFISVSGHAYFFMTEDHCDDKILMLHFDINQSEQHKLLSLNPESKILVSGTLLEECHFFHLHSREIKLKEVTILS